MFLRAYTPPQGKLARSILLASSLAITVARGGVGVRVCLFGEQTLIPSTVGRQKHNWGVKTVRN
jgi:uncharacterized protein (DUF58 family)